jgi:hypothetical protein
MVLRIGDKCELILIFKEAWVTLAVGALEVQVALALASYVFYVCIAHLAFPFLSCHHFGFICGFPPFNVPMPWCHLCILVQTGF